MRINPLRPAHVEPLPQRGLTTRASMILAARHGTARHGTARHGTARHGTARHGIWDWDWDWDWDWRCAKSALMHRGANRHSIRSEALRRVTYAVLDHVATNFHLHFMRINRYPDPPTGNAPAPTRRTSATPHPPQPVIHLLLQHPLESPQEASRHLIPIPPTQ
jgi:hypothetical protein